jgi:predicted dehydrogenase
MNTNPSGREGLVSRRRFAAGAGAIAAAAMIVPRHVLGGPRFVPPSERVNVGYIGCGTQGFRQMMGALESPDIRIPAVCDPVRRSDGYPDYGNDELNNKVRKFLGDPNWAKGAIGALCGREAGQEIVNRHCASKGEPAGCRAYADFREMLEQEKDLDAVYVMTPDHLHGVIALRALRQGKHVITHKPLSNVLAEARLARDTAKQTGVATHLFCAAGEISTPTVCEWLAAGRG